MAGPRKVNMENTFNILIADDDSSVYSASIKPFVNDLPEAKIYSASTPTLCRQMMAEHKFQFILLDISFGPNDASGMILLPELRKAQPQSKIFMLSTHDDQHTMMRCMQAGATDFISKRDINIPNIAKIIRGFIESQGQEQQDEASGLRLATIVGVSASTLFEGPVVNLFKGLTFKFFPFSTVKRVLAFSPSR